ncbi:anti-sigma-factor antagonist (STAS) and sugar transfersase [Neosynechococcus sphagnicola sy1]|uniref:Anti-sigma-factor antagonist (STAS) and sugar transfersase n=1 Tax=Neosynechococcus sphagnicola sy1 TaxID=1497020 RepID=A0A098TKE4_9CYAN|nr:sugar transferase [Neosynechococcus sphagnicola]KGF72764.1 anti-sigma-factor antagonist (STAS) and sugar transfersase [Neosynechococcus sphagnicola sy1]
MIDQSLPEIPQTIGVTVLNQVALLQVPSHLSKLEAAQFQAICQQQCQSHPVRLVLDFSRTIFLDSSGLGALMNVFRHTQQQGIELVLWSVSDQVKFVLSLAALDTILNVDPGTAAIAPTLNRPLRSQPFITHPSVRSRPKRLVDILGAIVGLSITAVIFLPLALAIWIDNPGPIFFSQIRCGLLGQRFRLWKFRSMVVNAEALKSQVENQAQGYFFKNRNDPRVTRVGRLLRKTSLDEFPQFWNVLIGDMSLVGTRPPTPDELERYDVPQWQRLDVRPGITGEWQVNGRSKIEKFEDVIRLDLKYQENWSFFYDLKLLLKTVGVLLSKDSGAF